MRQIDGRWRGQAPAEWPGFRGGTRALIGIDCDGVLASDRLLWQAMRKRYPNHIPSRYEDLQAYDWPRVTDQTTQLCLKLSADPAFAGRLAPIPYMAQALRHLHDAGYRLHVITARPNCVRGATRRWLARQGIGDCVEAISCVVTGLEKVDLARELGCAAFVEDNHATAEAMGAASVRSYLLDAPYNTLATRYSIRVRDWQELVSDLIEHVPARLARPRVPSRAPLAS
jgi:uncharacterized HAD superfamily protein